MVFVKFSKGFVSTLCLIAFALASPWAGSAHASDDTKLAFVDIREALQSVNTGKEAKDQLEKQYNSRKQELDNEKASVEKAAATFKKQSSVMSQTAREKKQGELQERYMKLQQDFAQAQQEMQQKQQELTDPIVSGLREVVAEIAKSKGYTAVFEKGENGVFFSQPKDDITSDVIAAYNKKHAG